MSVLTVRHSTTYRYSEHVGLGEHRIMFRPRESHDLRVLSSEIIVTPQPACVRWLHDTFDNSVAVVTFDGTTTELSFRTTVTLEHFEDSPPEYSLDDSARTYPFRYADEDLPNLSQALSFEHSKDCIAKWALQFLTPADASGTMNMLRAMTCGIREQFTYIRRPEKGVQTPEQTLHSRRGSCRDFAVLMIEACRSLGVAARFVSGYIYTPSRSNIIGGGATHAWMQAYLPGAGWVDFDPTNSIIGNRNLIPVAVAWMPKHVLPLWGTYEGSAAAFLGMDVTVHVSEAVGLD